MNETNHPARRLRHGERPTEPLVFEDAAANKAAEEGELPFAELSINQKRALSEGLSALEAMADIWSAEIRLSEMAQRIADAPAEQRPGTITAMIEQAFIEGAYRHFLDHKDEAIQYKIDAERYRWLRNDPPTTLSVRRHPGETARGCYLDGVVLDASIDVAMREYPSKEEK